MPTTRSLQELIVAAHFETPIPLTVMDLADWVSQFSEFSIVQQLPFLQPANFPVAGPPRFQLEMLAEISLPRMLLRTPDGQYSVQLQNDRFAFGWHRTEPVGEPSEYPGFEAIRRSWEEALARFDTWTESRLHQRANHRLVELTYNNVALLDKDGRRRRLSEIFKFVQTGPRKLGAFSASWIESIYPGVLPDTEPKAVVSAQVGLGSAPPDKPVLSFLFTGLGKVAGSEESKHMLHEIHAKIREIYESSIVPDAD
jgi:uncharacterized protein (TIGR04255 family)